MLCSPAQPCGRRRYLHTEAFDSQGYQSVIPCCRKSIGIIALCVFGKQLSTTDRAAMLAQFAALLRCHPLALARHWSRCTGYRSLRVAYNSIPVHQICQLCACPSTPLHGAVTSSQQLRQARTQGILHLALVHLQASQSRACS